MLDVYLLGTSGTVPLPNRWLTSCLLKYEGHQILIDCGEGTQIALKEAGVSYKHIDMILFTHYHADHTAGLPGLLLSMFKADRTEPVIIAGPKGIMDLIEGTKRIARFIPFDLQVYEYDKEEMELDLGLVHITAFQVYHSVTCYSYELNVKRKPRFEVEKAKEHQIPLIYWNRLQKGETLKDEEGHVYMPDMVFGEERKGIKVVYSTDTRPVPQIQEHAKDADLLIAEGMYGDPEKVEKAKLNRHMTMYEAAAIAKAANVKELWLTHYSPSMHNPLEYEDAVKDIFENTVISENLINKDITFE